jgi:uncharacterized protein (DUF488 family)
MTIYTIGYGGRQPEELVAMLKAKEICTVVDIRLRPDRASMGAFTKAKTPDKGIEKLLDHAGISYRSLIELGNVFLDFDDWQERFQRLLEAAGDLLTSRLAGIPEPYCLLCAEKRVAECHRRLVAEYMARRWGSEFVHLG